MQLSPPGAAVLLALSLAACGKPAADATHSSAQPQPGVQPQAAPAAPATPAAEAAPRYDFPLLARPGAPTDDPRIVSTDQDHPCGPVDTVRVAAMPVDDSVFRPLPVVEFDAAGKELQAWGIPNDAEVVALDGARLQFQAEAGRFWVDTRGTLEKVDATPPATDLRTQDGMFDCPALPTFKDSGAEQCFRVNDAAGTQRRIAMEGNCS